MLFLSMMLLSLSLQAEYCVSNVQENDQLNMRQEPNHQSKKMGALSPDECAIYVLNLLGEKGKEWYQVVSNEGLNHLYNGYPASWVRAKYLKKQISLDEGIVGEEEDPRIPPKNEPLSLDKELQKELKNKTFSSNGAIGLCHLLEVERVLSLYQHIDALYYDVYESGLQKTDKVDTVLFELKDKSTEGFSYRRKSVTSNQYLDDSWIKVKASTLSEYKEFSPLFPLSKECLRYQGGGIYTDQLGSLSRYIIGDGVELHLIDNLEGVANRALYSEDEKIDAYVLQKIVYDKTKTQYLRWDTQKMKSQLTSDVGIWHYRIVDKKTKETQDVFYKIEVDAKGAYSISYFDEERQAIFVKSLSVNDQNPLFLPVSGAVYFDGREDTFAYYHHRDEVFPSLSSYVDVMGKRYTFLDGYEGIVTRYEDKERIYELQDMEYHEKLKHHFDAKWKLKQ